MKKKLIDRIPWLRGASGDDTGTDEGQGDQESDVKDTQQPGEQVPGTESGETITIEQLVEQVTASVLEEVRAQIKPITEVLREMDEFIRTHDEALTHLVQDDTAKIKNMMEGGKYFADLYIRSKDAKAIVPVKDGSPGGGDGDGPKTRQLEAGESPSSVIFGHGRDG